jgi:hypothetical protein
VKAPPFGDVLIVTVGAGLVMLTGWCWLWT